ncbi:MAG: neutral zinc metallopeptidase, partial [Mucilaginibacter sp.]
ETNEKFAAINATWAKLFNRAGKHYTTPQLQLFKDSIIAYECGIAKPASGPFYGNSNKEIYLDLAFIDTIQKRFPRSADIIQNYVIAHQIGHYVASLLGKDDTSNRIETEQLADYYAGVWAHYVIKQNDYADDMTVAISNVTQLSNTLAQNDKISVPDLYDYSMLNGRSNWFYKGYESGDLNGPKTPMIANTQDQ